MKNMFFIVTIIVLVLSGYFIFRSKPDTTENTATNTSSEEVRESGSEVDITEKPEEQTTTEVTAKPQSITEEEVAMHNNSSSCYTIISGKVYDLTSWISKHPGGEQAILSLCGKDGTVAFQNQHGSNPKQLNILAGFFIGNLAQ